MPQLSLICFMGDVMESFGADEQLEVLVTEYHQRINAVQREFDTMLRVAGIAYTTAVAVATVVSTTLLELPKVAYWLAPFTFALLYAIVIQSFHRIVFTSYYLRDIEELISTKANINFFHFENAQARGLFSAKTGKISILATYALIFSVAATLYFALIFFCYSQLQSLHSPEYQLITYLAVNVGLGLTMSLSIGPVLGGLKSSYSKWIRESSLSEPTSDIRNAYLHFVFYGIIPRPLDFVLKSINMIIPAVLTLAFSGAPSSNQLLITLVLIFLCIELLAKQATYIWNDILDVVGDQIHPYKSTRGLARIGRARGLRPAKLLFLGRTAAALGLSAILWRTMEIWWLWLLVIVILLWQLIYDRWAKPAGGLRRLLVCAAGYSQRWLAGSLGVMSATNYYDLTLLSMLVCWGIGFAVVFLAAYWWAEADLLLRFTASSRKLGISDSLYRSWFLSRAHSYQRWSCFGLFLLSGALAGYYLEFDFWGYMAILNAELWIGLAAIAFIHDMLHLRKPVELRARLRMAVAVLVILFAIIAWSLEPTSGVYILAFVAPLLVLIFYDYNPYEDLMMVGLGARLLQVPAGINHFLFGKWNFTR